MSDEDCWKTDLAAFWLNNPSARLGKSEDKDESVGEKGPFIQNPWNDGSLLIDLSTENAKLIEALNNIVLPERLSAIWHKDSKDLEVIFQVFPLASTLKDLPNRNYVFRFGGES